MRSATRNFTETGVAGVVFEDDDVAREERSVRAAEVQQHAVVPGDGDDEHFSDDRGAGHSCGWIAVCHEAIKRGPSRDEGSMF